MALQISLPRIRALRSPVGKQRRWPGSRLLRMAVFCILALGMEPAHAAASATLATAGRLADLASGPTTSTWPSDAGNAAGTNYNANEAVLVPTALRLRWALTGDTRAYVVGNGEVFAIKEVVGVPGAVTDHDEYALVGYDAGSGTQQKQYFRFTGAYEYESLAYDAGRIYVTGREAIAFNANTTHRLFTTHVSSSNASGVMESPIVSGGVILTSIGRIMNGGFIPAYFALDARTGRILWRVDRDGASLSAAAGRVYVSYTDQGCDAPACVRGHGAAFMARTGHMVWSLAPTNEGYGPWMLSSGRLIQERVAPGSEASPGAVSTVAYSLNGKPLWRSPGFAPMAAAYGRVYGVFRGHAAALNNATGKLIWTSKEPLSPSPYGSAYGVVTSEVVANKVLYLTRTRDILALNASTGRRLAIIPVPQGYRTLGGMEVADGLLFVSAAPTQGWGSDLLCFGR